MRAISGTRQSSDAAPAPAPACGINGTRAVSGDCTQVNPPRLRIAARPAAPSALAPDNRMPHARVSRTPLPPTRTARRSTDAKSAPAHRPTARASHARSNEQMIVGRRHVDGRRRSSASCPPPPPPAAHSTRPAPRRSDVRIRRQVHDDDDRRPAASAAARQHVDAALRTRRPTRRRRSTSGACARKSLGLGHAITHSADRAARRARHPRSGRHDARRRAVRASRDRGTRAAPATDRTGRARAACSTASK